jgi:hypothetical protein
MKRVVAALIAAMAVLILASVARAGTTYVITNDGNIPNSASVYSLDATRGTLRLVKVLQTGGEGIGATFNGVMVAVPPGAGCLFVMDARSSDIAAFSHSTGYGKVGNYSNPMLDSSVFGGSIAVTPNGKWLYGSYTGSQNVGAWRVNPDCSLTFIAAYVPSVGADNFFTLGVTPNGLGLVVPAPNHQAAEVFKINSNGTLRDINFVTWGSDPTCMQNLCAPLGVDFTRDSKVAIFGNSGQVLLSVNLTRNGLTKPQGWNVVNAPGFAFPVMAVLGADAYAGSGRLYAGTFGGQVPGEEPQVTTVEFTENPLNLQAVITTVINSPNLLDAQIASVGNIMLVTELFNAIGVYRINSDGSLTLLNTVFDDNAGGLDSFAVYPNTR